MNSDNTGERIIRNQRRGGWPVLVSAVCWILAWIGSFLFLIHWTTSRPRYANGIEGVVCLTWVVSMLVVYVVILVRICRLPPMRIKLGSHLTIFPGSAIPLTDVRGLHFHCDPQEDFVESHQAISTCQLTVELAKKKQQMIVSLLDASRIHLWAKGHGVPVYDPQGYASRGDGH